jgi:hypothetical protein
MRYEVRWTNGYWKAFDTLEYTDAGVFDLRTGAQKWVDNRNTAR